jgi:hypothetical protein
MEKLLILALVLCIAAPVHGILILDVKIDDIDYGGELLQVATTVDVFIVQLEYKEDGIGGEITINVADCLNPVIFNMTPGPPDYVPPAGGNYWAWLTDKGIVASPNDTGSDFVLSKISTVGTGTPGLNGIKLFFDMGNPYVATARFSFETVVTTTIEVTGGNWDGTSYNPGALTEVVHVVPEPVTFLLLLGLGGILLASNRVNE